MYTVPGNSVLSSDSNVHKNGSDIKEPEGQVFLLVTGQNPHHGHRGPIRKEGEKKKEKLIHYVISSERPAVCPTFPSASQTQPGATMILPPASVAPHSKQPDRGQIFHPLSFCCLKVL